MTNSETEETNVVQPQALIDALAPDFEARTTLGLVKRSDYLGRWLVFFSHPADFTPVCTSEFVAFQEASDKFSELNCDLLGLSVDSLYAHIAWVRDIEERFGVRITFPIIEDISMAVSRTFGMIHDQSTTTAAVRSVFFIDPKGYIRAMIHYPMNIGRSVDEILRVLAALQITDEKKIATPEGWTPGTKTVLPPPLDQDEADTRTGDEGGAWYLTHVEDSK
ncbi:peroxiredoxin [Kordiimonas sp. SCSIO 12610]|uniref:peroxiredoxin n=1 Tax=Kordiimonas sp. SCSIO 12610 TaxID=2829597 RepID=UPI00210918B0|nr:peroxiredoxin [Kordiimonas sp. SCSIO 12610]UTW54642.1 peroxiredoxin [Kordiimonas sp. SCSIO 12610]